MNVTSCDGSCARRADRRTCKRTVEANGGDPRLRGAGRFCRESRLQGRRATPRLPARSPDVRFTEQQHGSMISDESGTNGTHRTDGQRDFRDKTGGLAMRIGSAVKARRAGDCDRAGGLKIGAVQGLSAFLTRLRPARLASRGGPTALMAVRHSGNALAGCVQQVQPELARACARASEASRHKTPRSASETESLTLTIR